MARKDIYVCDHCGAEFDAHNGFANTILEDLDFHAIVDLCENCYNQLSKTVYEFCNVGKR